MIRAWYEYMRAKRSRELAKERQTSGARHQDFIGPCKAFQTSLPYYQSQQSQQNNSLYFQTQWNYSTEESPFELCGILAQLRSHSFNPYSYSKPPSYKPYSYGYPPLLTVFHPHSSIPYFYIPPFFQNLFLQRPPPFFF